jgi:hypothetical protein
VEFLKLLQAAYKVLGRVLGRVGVVAFLASLVV